MSVSRGGSPAGPGGRQEEGQGLFSPMAAAARPGGGREPGKGAGRGPRREEDDDDQEAEGRGNVGPPPSFGGSLAAGEFEAYHIRAVLWLSTTKTPPKARGPRMLAQLTGSAFECAKHLVLSDEWLSSEDNRPQLLELLKMPENFGEEREE